MQANPYARLSQTDLNGAHELNMDTDVRGAHEGGINAAPLRPHVYYDDGPFDAPSSDSEEETLLEKDLSVRGRTVARSPGVAENGFANGGLALGEPKVSPKEPCKSNSY